MTPPKDRQRAAARARLQREMAARAEAAQKRRKQVSIIGAAVAAAVLITAVVLIISAMRDDDKKEPAAAATPCVWRTQEPDPTATATASASASASAAPSPTKTTRVPPATGEPREGIEKMTINTNHGKIVIDLDLAGAPCAAASFKYLAAEKYYNGSYCHRLSPSLTILQCGDPTATGSGNPDYTFNDENLPTDKLPVYVDGQVAMANSGPNTNGGQFFFIYGNITQLGASYTVVGRVSEGMQIVRDVAKAGFVEGTSTTGDPNEGKPKTKLIFNSITVSDPMPSPTPVIPTAVPTSAAASSSPTASAPSTT